MIPCPNLVPLCFLPPQTPRICRRIPHGHEARHIQVLLDRASAVQVELRHARSVRRPRLHKVGNVLLHGLGDLLDDALRAGDAVVEGVGDIEAVLGGRDGELVGEGLVAVCAVEVVGVAGEDGLGDDVDGAGEAGGPRVGTVVDGRVERLDDVLGDGGFDGGVRGFEVRGEGAVVGDVGGREEGPFVGVVADHDLEVLGEGALVEEQRRQGGDEGAVDDGLVDVAAVVGGVDLFGVGGDDGFRGRIARLFDAAHTEDCEEALRGVFLDEA